VRAAQVPKENQQYSRLAAIEIHCLLGSKEHSRPTSRWKNSPTKLTMDGLEVEQHRGQGEGVFAVLDCAVFRLSSIPNRDRLRVCIGLIPATGGRTVAGGLRRAETRARALISVFSPPGTLSFPQEHHAWRRHIRGVGEGRGMLCSAAELEISEDHDGIMERPADAPIGAPYAQWAGLGDPVLEIHFDAEPAGLHRRARIARDLPPPTWASFKDPASKQIRANSPAP